MILAKTKKVESVPNELGSLAVGLSRPGVEDTIWFLFDTYGKMWGERWTEVNIVKHKEARFDCFENSQPLQIANHCQENMLYR